MAQAPSREGGFSLLAYSRDGDAVCARMFAPLAGIPEDPATGSAACALAALLLHAGSLTQGTTLRAIPASRPVSCCRDRAGSGVCRNAYLDP